jgi:hypothetical protein
MLTLTTVLLLQSSFTSLLLTESKTVVMPELQRAAAGESKYRIEPNMGRYADEVRYVVFVEGGVVLFTDDGMVDSTGVGVVLRNSRSSAFSALGFRCAVRNTLESDGPMYIPIYSKLVRRNVYDGIDAIYELNSEGELEVSFFLQPGANLSDIAMVYQGVERMETTRKGELSLKTITGLVTHKCPRVLRYMGDRYVALPVAMKPAGDGLVRIMGRHATIGGGFDD